jgi:hypothetical protein
MKIFKDDEAARARDRRSDQPQAEREAVPRLQSLSPAAVLGLQRSAGNHAVARLLRSASERRLARAPVAGVDPTSDRFWIELTDVAESQLTRWLASYGRGIDQFESDLATEAGGGGELALDVFLTLLAFLPDAGELGVGVLTIAKGIYDELPLDSPLDLPTFLARARGNAERLSEAVVNHDPSYDLFRVLDDAQQREGEGEGVTDLAAREAAVAELTAALAKLPTWEQVRQSLTVDWVNSSEDSWDLDQEAGSIILGVKFAGELPLADPPAYTWQRPYIDDASRPEGVITALTGAFGADTPLELLPVEMIAYISTASLSATLVNPRTNASDVRDGPGWTLLSGSEELFDAWDQHRVIPTTNDLVAQCNRCLASADGANPRQPNPGARSWFSPETASTPARDAGIARSMDPDRLLRRSRRRSRTIRSSTSAGGARGRRCIGWSPTIARYSSVAGRRSTPINRTVVQTRSSTSASGGCARRASRSAWCAWCSRPQA